MNSISSETYRIFERILNDPEQTEHDQKHLSRVYTLARSIGFCEELPAGLQQQLEIAAILHDIACPRLRLQYGTAPGKKQEELGAAMVRDYLEPEDLPQEMKERIAFLVGHHHTWTDVEGIDWQILLEADYIVNAIESGWSPEQNQRVLDTLFVTRAGKHLLQCLIDDPSAGLQAFLA